MKTHISRVARHHIGTESLQTASTHLTEVSMKDAGAEERCRLNQLEEPDVVVAVERRVDTNGKFHVVRLSDFCAQLLNLSTTSVHVSTTIATRFYHKHVALAYSTITNVVPQNRRWTKINRLNTQVSFHGIVREDLLH